MRKKPYGCLTLPGLAAGLLTVLVVSLTGILRGGTLFSPGSLNAQAGTLLGGVTSHAEIGGRCSACHSFFWQSSRMADRCVTCHMDVASQLNDPTSLHGVQYQENSNLTCRICHPDHRGLSASLTDMSMVHINHETFGYSLNAHQQQVDGTPFACKTCHVAGYTAFDQIICFTCHQQINPDFMFSHQQAYGQDCLACHDGIDTYGSDFDHDTTAFQLVGKHNQLACVDCHPTARSIADLKATPQDCYSCHAGDDAHQGEFGAGCATCHTPDGWLPASFDHALTRFPLTGAHTQIECTQCHNTLTFAGLSLVCSSCHTDPAIHAGLFAGMTCDQCHSTSAWAPASFNLNHPAQCDDENCINHEEASCRDCHPDSLSTATCLKCHSSNNPDDDHGDDD